MGGQHEKITWLHRRHRIIRRHSCGRAGRGETRHVSGSGEEARLRSALRALLRYARKLQNPNGQIQVLPQMDMH